MQSRRGAVVAIALPDRAGVGALGGHEGLGRPTLAVGDLGHCSAGRDGLVVVRRTGRVAFDRAFVAMLDQQPGVLRLAGLIALQPHDHPGSVHPLAFHDELQFALGQRLADVLEALLGRPVAAVPQHDRAAAILALGDGAFEIAILERMILDLHRHPAVLRVERRRLRHRPRPERPLVFEAQIEVQVAGRVLLDDEAQRF